MSKCFRAFDAEGLIDVSQYIGEDRSILESLEDDWVAPEQDLTSRYLARPKGKKKGTRLTKRITERSAQAIVDKIEGLL